MFKNYEALKDFIMENTLKEELILIKGSRGMQLERILKLIT